MREYIDDEFAFQLLDRFEDGDKEAAVALEWLAKYNNEFYKGFLKKGDPDAIHNTAALYKSATDSQNAKRRDLIGAVTSGKLGQHVTMVSDTDVSWMLEESEILSSRRDLRHEDHLIELIVMKLSLGL